MKLFDFTIKEGYEKLPPAWCGIFASKHYAEYKISTIGFYLRSPFTKHSRYVDPDTMDWTEGKCSFLRYVIYRVPYKAYVNGKHCTLYKRPMVKYFKEWVGLPK